MLSLSSIENLLQPAAQSTPYGGPGDSVVKSDALQHPSEESVLQNLDGKRDWRVRAAETPVQALEGRRDWRMPSGQMTPSVGKDGHDTAGTGAAEGASGTGDDRHIEHSARDHVSRVLEEAQLYYSSRSRDARAGDRGSNSTPSAASMTASPLRSLTGAKKGVTGSVAFSGRDQRF